MAESRAPSGGDITTEAGRRGLTDESQEYLQYLQGNPTLLDGATHKSPFSDLGGGTVLPTIQNPMTDPSASYAKYREGNKAGFNPDAYTGFSDNVYTLGMPTTTMAAQRYLNNGGDLAYAGQQRADEALDLQRGAMGRLGTAGQNAVTQQGALAGLQQGMAGKAAGVRVGPVGAQQSLQGQSDYQGYLQQLAQGRSSADAMQAQASMFGEQYQRPDTTAAMMQHRQATDAALQSNLALARSSPGAGSMARALVANAGATQSAAAQSAQLQAQQEAALRGAWMTAQGNAQQAYQGLSQQQGQMAGLGSQTYIAAQRANMDAATAEANRYLGAGQAYGAAANTWQGAGSQELGAAQAYAQGAQNYYGAAAQERQTGVQLAQAQQQLYAQKEQRDYQEWLRQQGYRQQLASQRYSTMTGTAAANTASSERAQMYNAGSASKGTGVALSTAGSALGAGIGLGTAAYAAQAKNNEG